ncbi:PH domain-containing protein [Ligilactobacillus animalis]|uniref:PH domain-containing protein n=1 Tax=Ligilactobacillus animalis TaxID=1605 RepID=UPI001C117A1C|nr:PH domain-containing protein [Ligilactobacillus animalis]MBU5279900.1 PH domain-containing protein [Ligilactobacillus animalis]MDU3187985.1 PH domain-containing protein [Ligilactobacillus animalis]
MQTFTVAKQYLYYRFSLAFITYALLLLLGYFLLQYFNYSDYFQYTLFFGSICFSLDCLRSFFYWKYARLHFSSTAVIVTKGLFFYSKTTIPLEKIYIVSESTNAYLQLFKLKRLIFQTIAQAASFAGIIEDFQLPVKVGGRDEG